MAAAAAYRAITLQGPAFVNEGLNNPQIHRIQAATILCIGDGRHQNFANKVAAATVVKLKNIQGVFDALAADQVSCKAGLAWADSRVAL